MQEIIPNERSPCDDAAHPADSDPPEKDATHALNHGISEDDGLELLDKVVRHDAIHHGYPPPSAQNPTTLDQRLRDWVDNSEPPCSIMWLAVAQGVSKLAPAHKVISLRRSSDRFVGTFICRAGEGDDLRHALVPTIAYQLANSIEDIRGSIVRTVVQNPSLLDEGTTITAQFESLIVRPFQESSSIPLRSYIVAIVGLDEFNDRKFELEVLDLIADAVTKHQLPLRFLISSHAEAFRDVFASEPLKSCSTMILLSDTSSTNTDSSASNLPHSDGSAHPFLRLMPSSKKTQRRRLSPSRRRPSHMESFPRLVTVQRSNGQAESYTRSLLMTGHGFPLWYPGGDLGKPPEYLRQGVSLGDVGVLDRDGVFDFCFNIYRHPDDPIHSSLVPREFKPVEGGLKPSEIRFQPDYFKPGTVITSKGITVTRQSESPLDLSFSSTEQEGGIVVLPNGASREDLIDTERIHDYTKRNAPYWYQDVNGYGGVVHTNGSLFVVTGCDKTNDWAIASFPYYSGTKTPLDLQYTLQPNHGAPWVDHGTARTSSYEPSTTSQSIAGDADAKHQCIFVRGMRISLSSKSWEEAMPVTKSAKLYYTYILHTPSSLELVMNNILVYLHLRLSERRALKKVTPNRLQLFHPNYVIGQVLLQDHPESDVALVDDSVWCQLTHESICTISKINELVTAVFDRYEPVEKDGMVTLELKTIPKSPQPARRSAPWAALPLLPKFLKQRPEKKDVHWVQDIPVSEHAKLF